MRFPAHFLVHGWRMKASLARSDQVSWSLLDGTYVGINIIWSRVVLKHFPPFVSRPSPISTPSNQQLSRVVHYVVGRNNCRFPTANKFSYYCGHLLTSKEWLIIAWK